MNTCYRGSDKQPRQSSRPRHTQPKQQASKSKGIWKKGKIIFQHWHQKKFKIVNYVFSIFIGDVDTKLTSVTW